MSRLGNAIRALLGRSTYQRDITMGFDLDDPRVIAARERMGGQLIAIPITQTRWLNADLETAQIQADTGILWTAAKLWNACKRDGVFSGVLSTRTGGLVRLPKRFRGDPEMVEELQLGHDSIRSVFDEMFPPAELARLAGDGIGLGVGVAELLPVAGRDYPVLCTLPPENLVYWWSYNRWFYRSIAGLLPITPGDGRWILHTPGGRIAPWQHGIWRAVGRAFIAKEHALLCDANWQAKLANPARVAVSPQGATDEEVHGFFQKVAAWAMNPVFGMRPGWDVKLVESNGRGSDSYERTVNRSNNEFVIAVAGQTVTTDGGAGFQNSDIHRSIRADLIEETGSELAHTLNTQGIPPWVLQRWGEERLSRSPCVAWDVQPPRDRNLEALSLVSTANAITTLTQAFEMARAEAQKMGATSTPPWRLDIAEMASRFGIPVLGDRDGNGIPDDDEIELLRDENAIDVEFEDVTEDDEPQQDAAE